MNKLIIQNNKTCKIDLVDNGEFLSKIRKILSYQQEGYEYTVAHKVGGWNGIICLLTSKNIFPIGLQYRIEKLLQDNNINYELEDKRQKLEQFTELDVSDILRNINFMPRDYQLSAVEAAVQNRRGILHCCTGSGKTAIGSLIAAKHNTTTIIYVIGLQLLAQFHQTLTQMLGQPIGFIGNGVCDIQKINVASVWTIGKALDLKGNILDDEECDEKETFKIENKLKILDLLKRTKLHIIDEMHASGCNTIKAIVKNIDPIKIFGMSGTPHRHNGHGDDLVLEGIFGSTIIEVSAAELIEKKILVQPHIKFINIPTMTIYGRTYAEVYSQYIVENEMRNDIILREAKNLISRKFQTLVLFKHIKHGNILFELFKKNNINCELLHGSHSLEKREEIKQKLLNGELDLILASQIFDIGVDIKTLNGLILAGGGKSKIRTIQRIGRIIRGNPGKEMAAICDFIDNIRFLKQHSQIRHATYAEQKGFKIYLPSQNYGK